MIVTGCFKLEYAFCNVAAPETNPCIPFGRYILVTSIFTDHFCVGLAAARLSVVLSSLIKCISSHIKCVWMCRPVNCIRIQCNSGPTGCWYYWHWHDWHTLKPGSTCAILHLGPEECLHPLPEICMVSHTICDVTQELEHSPDTLHVDLRLTECAHMSGVICGWLI